MNQMEAFFKGGTRTLPDSMLAKTVAFMLDGEIGYVVPWAMMVDAKNKMLYIDKDSVVKPVSSGTSFMKIKKQGKEIVVDFSSIGEFKYLLSNVKKDDCFEVLLMLHIKDSGN